MTEEETFEDVYFRSPVLGRWETFRNFFWKSETKELLGRTALSWGKITLFYLIFYSVLAGVVMFWMWLFLQTLDAQVPKWILDKSLIGTNPGVGFRPMPVHNEESTLIWIKNSNQSNYVFWNNQILQYLDVYYKSNKSPHLKTCSYWNYPDNDKKEVCRVNVNDWGDCNKEQFFDNNNNSICIFIKLNKIYNWVPEYYDEPYNLPEEMPKSLKKHIENLVNPEERKNVWVSCQGEYPADIEHVGKITYYPKGIQGFPGYYFPYLNTDGYLPPLVAVKFENPTPGIMVNVECRAWAKNIKYNRADRMGSVHFELLLD